MAKKAIKFEELEPTPESIEAAKKKEQIEHGTKEEQWDRFTAIRYIHSDISRSRNNPAEPGR
jgi:hypothetical protein